jgi:predicted nucleic acid-binding protein
MSSLLPLGQSAVDAGADVLRRIELTRINDLVLREAGMLRPGELRSLDAIHLATALQFGDELRHIVTYDDRLAEAARTHGMRVQSPS